MIDGPGVYKTTVKDYHTDSLLEKHPTLNASALIDMLRSPLHCWHNHPRLGGASVNREHKKHMERGSALHAMVLGSGEVIRRIDADSYRSKEAQAERDAAVANWEIPLLYADYDEIEHAALAVKMQLSEHGDASRAFTDGQPEMTLLWEERGVWCRVRLDYLADRMVFDDLKGTGVSAEPESFMRKTLFNLNYDIRAAFYLRGIRALGLHEDPVFRFIVAEMNAPYAISAVACSEELIQAANVKVEQGIRLWRHCLAKNRWPGYGDMSYWAGVPAWRTQGEQSTEETDE